MAQVVVYGAIPLETTNTTFGLAVAIVEPLTGELIVTIGSTVLMVHVKLAGVASALPAASVAATVNVWLPVARPLYAFGLVQLAAAPPSMTQLNVLPASVEVNEKLALVLLVGFVGFAVIVVFGATVSTLKLTVAAPTFVAASVAVTTTLCAPSVRPAYAFGLVQLVAAPPSIAQVVVYGATPLETANTTFGLAVLIVDALTGELIVTTGRVVLIVQVKLAGVASALPAASVAATVNVWLPAARPV
jgi:hypothetical protein